MKAPHRVIGMKACKDCHQSKPESDYYKGHRACKSCLIKKDKARRDSASDFERQRRAKLKAKAKVARIKEKESQVSQICKGCERPYSGSSVCPSCKAKQRQRVQSVVDWMNQIKATTPCKDCGEIGSPDRMHWDHLPSAEKKGNVSDFVWNGSKTKAEEEMAKCELVCRGCHVKRSTKRGQLTGRPIGEGTHLP